MTYTAPLDDMLFNLRHLVRLDELAALDGFEDAGMPTAAAVLAECARFNEEAVAPLNAAGDREPAVLADDKVTTTPGFKDAFRRYAEGGWLGVQHPAQYGGQALPRVIAAACSEIVNAANLSFALCDLLSNSAIAALVSVGSDAMRDTYLPKLISGQWTGTMNLTEPQAGSDVGLVRTRAERQSDGTYKLFGTKIFITYGEHDLTENIVHLILARVAGAPAGVKGVSMFLVPKVLVNADGSLGKRNDVHAASLEHKLGIKASPTAVMQYGENGGATGYLIGEENRGLEYMFQMMNSARFAVGVQGVAIADRAYQQAVAYARERVQGRSVGAAAAGSVPIIAHPDVRRMLMEMRSKIQGCRAMIFAGAAAADLAERHPDAGVRQSEHDFYEFLLPLIKGYCTEMSLVVTSLGIQVHGGMGFIEETGAAQYYRDARILPIYEGTTAIQANDLVGRKTLRDGGAVARDVAARIESTEAQLAQSGSPAASAVRQALEHARRAFLEVVDHVVSHGGDSPEAVYAGSVPYLMLAGELVAGWQLGRALLAAERTAAAGESAEFLAAKAATALFFAEHVLVQAPVYRDRVLTGARSVLAMAADQF
ncbi:acyl-CoA dehydrogenase [Cupriavidus taiwanensis]|uniref:3-methylmercaptopropionyl-CoA dehydrogenase n=1 Tax=Cupriavidus taiwanensis TaxID=164546 RepID=A0A375IW69_9BURK|nr:acyl-CoA dehydrogenase [Cupriavidus taiwanensis]SPR96399.1 Acyl-CoA dehydrogenase [Cupriavidus taiwanensis]